MSKKETTDAEFKEGIRAAAERAKHPPAVWLRDAVGKVVTIYSHRAPVVHGTVKEVDLRFGKVMVENDKEEVEVSMSGISQVRYSK